MPSSSPFSFSSRHCIFSFHFLRQIIADTDYFFFFEILAPAGRAPRLSFSFQPPTLPMAFRYFHYGSFIFLLLLRHARLSSPRHFSPMPLIFRFSAAWHISFLRHFIFFIMFSVQLMLLLQDIEYRHIAFQFLVFIFTRRLLMPILFCRRHTLPLSPLVSLPVYASRRHFAAIAATMMPPPSLRRH
jgi:hypothetical protein